MIWDPVFSPNGEHVAARATQGEKFYLVINGRVVSLGCVNLWDPIFSPDGSGLLIREVEFGKLCRKIIPIEKLLR